MSTPSLPFSTDVQITCGERSIHVKWKVDKSMTGNPSRLFLGSCFASHFSNQSNEGPVADFYYGLNDCGFRRMVSLISLIAES